MSAFTCLWYSVAGPAPVSVILIRDKSKTGYDIALVTTENEPDIVRTIERYAARWAIDVGHRCCASSWIGFSRLSSLSFFLRFPGFGLGRCPAGAGVVAGRAVPALAELG